MVFNVVFRESEQKIKTSFVENSRKIKARFGEIKEVSDAGYERGFLDGQQSMIDESKIIERTYTDAHQMYVDDVSEIPHDIKIKLTDKNGNVVPNKTITVNNQNLVDLSTVLLNTWISGAGVGYGFSFQAKNGRAVIPYVKVMPNTLYTMSLDNSVYWLNRIVEADENNVCTYNHSHYTNTKNDFAVYTFLTQPKTKYLAFTLQNKVVDNATMEDIESIDLQVEQGGTQTSYALRKNEEYITNENGEVVIKSQSPIMLVDANSDDIDISFTYHKSWGMNTAQEIIWDGIQLGGTKNSYANYFVNWLNDRAFRPKYDLNAETPTYMFWGARLGNVKQVLQRQGVKLITKRGVNFTCFIRDAVISYMPEIDLTSATNMNMFGYYSHVRSIDKLIVTETTPFASNSFLGWEGLVNLIIEGSIGVDINLRWSTALSHDSIVSIINALSNNTSGLTATLSLKAVNKAFETSEGANDGSNSTEWQTLVNTKTNWTINLS